MAAKKKAKFELAPTVMLFETKLSPRLYRIMTVVSVVQLPMWLYLSYFSITHLDPVKLRKEVEKSKKKAKLEGEESGVVAAHSSSKEWRKENGKVGHSDLESSNASVEGKSTPPAKNPKMSWLLSYKSRAFLSVLCLAFGTVFCMGTLIFPLRMVRSVTFMRPTQTMQIVTGTPFGTYRTFDTPLSGVVCKNDLRTLSAASYIILKVKGHYFTYLLNYANNVQINPLFKTLVLSRR